MSQQTGRPEDPTRGRGTDDLQRRRSRGDAVDYDDDLDEDFEDDEERPRGFGATVLAAIKELVIVIVLAMALWLSWTYALGRGIEHLRQVVDAEHGGLLGPVPAVVLFSYLNPLLRGGNDALRRAADAGAHGVLVTDLPLGSDPERREWGLRMIIVSRCLERIGDHAVDIGEQTAYLVTGEFREFTDASHTGPPNTTPRELD